MKLLDVFISPFYNQIHKNIETNISNNLSMYSYYRTLDRLRGVYMIVSNLNNKEI